MSQYTYHLFSHTILHCGTGQSLGIVDQPIARDRASQLPLVPGSTVRGVLREQISRTENTNADHLFGPGLKSEQKGFAGALSISDAHLLLLPVRSVYGILAYATCPFILRRYSKDCQLPLKVPTPKPEQALIGNLNTHKNLGKKNKIVLEDLDLVAGEGSDTQQWAQHFSAVVHKESPEQEEMQNRFIILPDDVFSFLAETATEIRTRIRIDQENGVVADGALWTEENLPAETLLWGIYSLTNSRKPEDEKTASKLNAAIPKYALLQMGGNVGTGNGLVEFRKYTQEPA
ncbi:type III-B CRISPR module RAMP protein Cmr4 [Gynuella sp.]|uniref:type III-B CRISPR module RAMP protein Cmr4 n=1 Tax=Gynuella sp. TaxID=2969146 RepID=UPI003D10BBCC